MLSARVVASEEARSRALRYRSLCPVQSERAPLPAGATHTSIVAGKSGQFYGRQNCPGGARALCLRKASVGQGLITDAESSRSWAPTTRRFTHKTMLRALSNSRRSRTCKSAARLLTLLSAPTSRTRQQHWTHFPTTSCCTSSWRAAGSGCWACPSSTVAVSGLGSLCKDVLEQLYRLHPLVYRRVHSLPATMERLTHCPWRCVLLYTGEPTATVVDVVVDEARRGHVRSIDARRTTLTPAVAKRVVPELLGVGCSLLDLKLEGLQLGVGSWSTAMFGEAAVCSTALLELQLDDCGLSGPLPELNLPALQILWLSRNQMSGGLEPLMRCTALQEIDLEPAKATFPWQLTLASCRDIGRIYNEHFTTYDVALWRRRGAWRGEVD